MLKAFVGAVALSVALSGAAFAADVQGKIKSVDPSGSMVTLDDGTQIVIPPIFTVEKSALKPGVNVKVSYDEKDMTDKPAWAQRLGSRT